jgi:hypothetical protein
MNCNEIQQNINASLIAFADCKKYTNSDLTTLVELIQALNDCDSSGSLEQDNKFVIINYTLAQIGATSFEDDIETLLAEYIVLQNIKVNEIQLYIFKIQDGLNNQIYILNNKGKGELNDINNDDLFLLVNDTNRSNYIKSNESLALAQRVDDTLYGILDQYTGEEITLEKTTDTNDADGVIYFDLGAEKFKRNFTFLRPEWFGLDGVNDQVAINLALSLYNSESNDNYTYKNGIPVELTAGKEYFTSAPIEMTMRQQLIGNGARIVSTSTTTVIKGVDSLLSNLYHHRHVIVKDLDIVSSTCQTAIDLKGFIFSNFSNIKILMFECDSDSVAVRMCHGSNGFDFCYYNRFEGYDISMFGQTGVEENVGTGILIGGVNGVSGANINYIGKGVISGRELVGIKIDNNSNGNVIEIPDFEAFNKFDNNIAIHIVNGNFNQIQSPHVENYYKVLQIEPTSNGNIINNINASAITVPSTDNGLFNTYNTDGSFSVGNLPIQNTYPQIQVSGSNYPSFIFESRNDFADARNWALRCGFTGESFDFVRSTAKGSDPLLSSDYKWRINESGYFVLPIPLRVVNMFAYNNNTIALADGFPNGQFYKSAVDGVVRVTQTSVLPDNEVAHISDTKKTGWASYKDTFYTLASPFTILDTVTSAIPNNAGTIINNQLPLGVTSFYDSGTGKITPELVGDYYVTTIRLKASTTATLGGHADFGIDVGGALGVIFKETVIFAKGANVEHNFAFVCPGYTAATFVANGGIPKLTALGGGDVKIYDIEFQIDRTHKAV